MFEGDKECGLCGKCLEDEKRNFTKSMLGHTYVFCNVCFLEKRGEIRKLLRDE